MSALSVAVIQGGPSAEAEVSRAGALSVCEALERRGHHARRCELDSELPAVLMREPVDVVFPVTHGALGEDGGLQGLLEVLGLAYVGSGVLASALASSKPHAKQVYRAVGLPVAQDLCVSAGEPLDSRISALRASLGPAFVAKPAAGGSAIGVELISAEASDAEAASAIERVLQLETVALLESFVPGDEVTCGVLERLPGAEALPPTLIRPRATQYYDFVSKYRQGGSEHLCPAPFERELLLALQQAALLAHRALGCRDLSRTDFLVDVQRGSFVVLETNTLPGMTRTSLFPEAAAAQGIPFEVLCDALVRRAVERPRRKAPVAMPLP